MPDTVFRRQPTILGRRTTLKLMAAAGALLGPAGSPVLVHAAPRVSTGAVEPTAGTWRTWLLAKGSDLRLPPPPDSQAELANVRGMVSSANAATLDRIAYWDAGAPPYRWNEIGHYDLVARAPQGFAKLGNALVIEWGEGHLKVWAEAGTESIRVFQEGTLVWEDGAPAPLPRGPHAE